ncbi:MAG: hypothetical protein PHQ43_10200 [Dehalococcoidales bacterium]|nr:hypothetical protein [Dehalococcoidales bacterium]
MTVTPEGLKHSTDEWEGQQAQLRALEGRVSDAHDFEAWRFAHRKQTARQYEKQRVWFYGTVTKLGRYGFKVEGDDKWLNWCRNATPEQPEVGKEYRIVVDSNWHVHQVIPVVEGTFEVIPF